MWSILDKTSYFKLLGKADFKCTQNNQMFSTLICQIPFPSWGFYSDIFGGPRTSPPDKPQARWLQQTAPEIYHHHLERGSDTTLLRDRWSLELGAQT